MGMDRIPASDAGCCEAPPPVNEVPIAIATPFPANIMTIVSNTKPASEERGILMPADANGSRSQNMTIATSTAQTDHSRTIVLISAPRSAMDTGPVCFNARNAMDHPSANARPT
jgi:hypothetical protein